MRTRGLAALSGADSDTTSAYQICFAHKPATMAHGARLIRNASLMAPTM